ncbi:MAG: UDP-N-acetylmuramate dehydrogenase [Boseongicola sp. SB0677_bin_26]|nr:UDP-N-acetylmuramate dehydrogenase [Boseongicola sp. SB0665_bin_10]MYG26658.1 UDP-N-acetylmuramate dehydrogenase [Boseongicola sp. SB0677_bin_26]
MGGVDEIEVRGRLVPGYDLSGLTWLRVGGPADWLFLPNDIDDLSAFLAALPDDIAVFPMGVGSNLIVRDGGLRAVVIRLGREFADISVDGDIVTAGAGARDAQVAGKAAEAGLDLVFLCTIPGAVGGAVRMNAGCYGSYISDHFMSAEVVLRDGSRANLGPDSMNFGYRKSELPEGAVVVSARFRAELGDPEVLKAKIKTQIAKREETQPTRALTAGSTFRNPAGYSSTGKADDTHELKAWKVIEDAGLRGTCRGQAQMSAMHPNFLVNLGGATAADLEALGEEVRTKVFQHSGIALEWEIARVGEPAPKA